MDGRCIGLAHTCGGHYPTIVRDRESRREAASDGKTRDPHLRSTRDMSGHSIQASDGEIGHVDDFIVDDETWAIRYLVIDTRNWWPGKKVLISPQWIERVSWSELKVFVNLTREAIKQSPEYLDESLPTRDYEIGLHRHYSRQATGPMSRRLRSMSAEQLNAVGLSCVQQAPEMDWRLRGGVEED